MSDLNLAFLLISAALVISALVSGLVLRGPISFPIIFLGLGLLLGAYEGERFHIDAHDQLLEAVATASLAFVLFLDALKLQVDEAGRDWKTPALVLGPGTLITVGLIAGGAWLLLDVTVAEALLLGAALASTDAVVMRDIVRDKRLPRSMRRVLSIEAGVNDIVVLPLILVLIAVAQAEVSGVMAWARFSGEVFLIGPLVGAVVASGGAWLMMRVDQRVNISREYQALFGVGLVLLTYVAATFAGGDGFLAAFAGGLAVVLFNQELCDCFMEFGETLVEMLMLLAFVLFGIALAGLLGDVYLPPAIALAIIAVLVARPLAIAVALFRARIGFAGKVFLAWFGPRGLSSLLLALLIVQAGLAVAEYLLGIVGVVVIASVVLHGVSATPAISLYESRVQTSTQPEERYTTLEGLLESLNDRVRLTAGELLRLEASEDPPVIVDVRTRSQYAEDPAGIAGGVRVPLDEVEDWAAAEPTERLIVTYCT